MLLYSQTRPIAEERQRYVQEVALVLLLFDQQARWPRLLHGQSI
jgi:hypothetical protein